MSTRFRRTALMIEIDNQRTLKGLPTLSWKTMDRNQIKVEYEAFRNQQNTELDIEVVGSKDDKDVLTETKLVPEQFTQLVTQVTSMAMNEVDKARKEIMAKLIPQKVVVAIKVNDKILKEKIDSPHPSLSKVINILTSGLNILLVGPAGCGKTLLADQCAKVLGLEFGTLCFSTGASETWLFGRQTPTGFIEGEFSKLYKNGGVFLADEFDAADANLLLAINTALANGVLYNPISGEKILKHPKFYFIGAANTFGKGQSSQYTGRNRLDAATLDRFVSLPVTYIEEVENKICPIIELANQLRDIRKIIENANSGEIISYRAFDKAYTLYSLGYSDKEIKELLTASFNDQLKKLIK